MKMETLIKLIDQAYSKGARTQEGSVLNHFREPDAGHEDHLARFLALDTRDCVSEDETDDGEQVTQACHNIDGAIKELKEVSERLRYWLEDRPELGKKDPPPEFISLEEDEPSNTDPQERNQKVLLLLKLCDELQSWTDLFSGGIAPSPSLEVAENYFTLRLGETEIWNSKDGFKDEQEGESLTLDRAISCYVRLMEDLVAWPKEKS